MNFDVITLYPGWLIIACIVVGVAFAMLLYFRNSNDELPKWLVRTLSVIRAATVAIMAFLLLSPLIKSVTGIVEKPVIVFLQDNSSSVIQDKKFDPVDYKANLADILSDLREDFEVDLYSFGDNIERIESEFPDSAFYESSTDISLALDEISVAYENRNVGAIILASDGIYNRGMNPFYAMDFEGYPVYTIALGDTAQKKDALIRNVNHNSLAYMGNDFPVEVMVQSFNCSGEASLLEIVHQGNVLFSELIRFTSPNFSRSIRARLPAEVPGINSFTIRLKPLDDEVNTANNKKVIYIDILDARKKTLILAHSPHPDITAIKEAIRSNYHFESEYFLVENFDGNLKEYNLVILHQLPSSEIASFQVLNDLKKSEVPVLYILGSQTDLNLFNGMDAGLMIENASGSLNEAQPAFNQDFMLFQFDEKTRNIVYFQIT